MAFAAGRTAWHDWRHQSEPGPPMRCTILAIALLAALPLHAQDSAPQGCGVFEAVEPGDSLQTISQRCGVPLSVLAEANPAAQGDLQPGTVVSLDPTTPAAPAPEPGEISVVGAAAGYAQRRYEKRFTGTWFERGAECSGTDGTWVFEATTMRHEEERCDIRAFEAAMDEIVVTAACARQGQTPRDRTFTLNLTDIDAMSIDTGGDKVGVQRCAG